MNERFSWWSGEDGRTIDKVNVIRDVRRKLATGTDWYFNQLIACNKQNYGRLLEKYEEWYGDNERAVLLLFGEVVVVVVCNWSYNRAVQEGDKDQMTEWLNSIQFNSILIQFNWNQSLCVVRLVWFGFGFGIGFGICILVGLVSFVSLLVCLNCLCVLFVLLVVLYCFVCLRRWVGWLGGWLLVDLFFFARCFDWNDY